MIRVSNIGPGQRQRRRVIGVIAVSVGVGLAIALIWLRAMPGWLVLTFVPFFVGMLGFVQAREHT